MLGDKGADVRVETCPRLTLLHLLLLRSVHHVLLLLPMEIGHLLLLVSSDLLGVHTVRVLHLLVPIIVVCSTATAARPLPAAVIIVTGLVIPATLLRRVLLLRRVIHLRVVHVWCNNTLHYFGKPRPRRGLRGWACDPGDDFRKLRERGQHLIPCNLECLGRCLISCHHDHHDHHNHF